MKTVGIEVKVRIGIEDFDKLSLEEQNQALCNFENKIAKMINDTPEMTFLDGIGNYVKGIETDDGYIKIVNDEVSEVCSRKVNK